MIKDISKNQGFSSSTNSAASGMVKKKIVSVLKMNKMMKTIR